MKEEGFEAAVEQIPCLLMFIIFIISGIKTVACRQMFPENGFLMVANCKTLPSDKNRMDQTSNAENVSREAFSALSGKTLESLLFE